MAVSIVFKGLSTSKVETSLLFSFPIMPIIQRIYLQIRSFGLVVIQPDKIVAALCYRKNKYNSSKSLNNCRFDNFINKHYDEGFLSLCSVSSSLLSSFLKFFINNEK